MHFQRKGIKAFGELWRKKETLRQKGQSSPTNVLYEARLKESYAAGFTHVTAHKD
jgi:hypothetical protein